MDMLSVSTAVLVAQADGDHLSVARVLSNIPHDAASVFVYLLLIASVVVVVMGGRSRKRGDGGES